MRAAPDFTLDELIRSATAERLGIDNLPPPEEMDNLRLLAIKILQPPAQCLATSHHRYQRISFSGLEQGTGWSKEQPAPLWRSGGHTVSHPQSGRQPKTVRPRIRPCA